MPTFRRDVVYQDFPFFVDQVTVRIAVANDFVGFSHIHRVPVKGDAIGLAQAGYRCDLRVGDPVVVAVGQSHYAIDVGDVQYAVGIEGH